VDVEWCRDRLQQYGDAVVAYQASKKDDGPEWREMQQCFPTAQAILHSLYPGSLDFDLEHDSNHWVPRKMIFRGIGMLEDRAVLTEKLAPDAPVLTADRMHSWVWEAARPLWEIQQFRQALLTAATAVNAHLQAKVGRRDVSDDKLIQECFSDKEPELGKPRLRVPGDHTDQTVQSRQRGTMQMALGCVWAIRNPAAHLAAHDAGELGEQETLEQLATLSTLARFLDECVVLTVDPKDQDGAV
jgi:Protein of unknown function (Hypoth_ymh)